MRSDINKAFIAGYPNAESKGTVELSDNSVLYPYEGLYDLVDSVKPGDELKPQVFKYISRDENGKIDLDRTCVVSGNQYAEISTYFKNGKEWSEEWSTIKVAETVPEGVMIVNLSLPAGPVSGIHGIGAVSFSLASNETITEQGLEAGKIHPGKCCSFNFPRIHLIGTEFAPSSEEELKERVSAIPSMGVKNYYNQVLERLENMKKEQEAQEQEQESGFKM